jgi:dihydroflavonol-4-reductase
MKAFITGGTGFIGSHLVDTLLDQGGNEIRCMVRSNEKWLEGKEYKKINCDLNDISALQKAMDGVDVVFHLAGVVKAKETRVFERVNVEGTENLLRVAQKLGVPKVVISSSQAAAGPSINKPVTEDDEMLPVSRYGESKMRMENMIHRIADGSSQVSIIRPSSVYGPREEDIYTFFKIAAKGICPIVGRGQGKSISIAHVNDIVNGILLASNHEHQGVRTYFLSSERGYNWHEIRDATSNALGRKLLTINVPARMVKSVGKITESTASFFGNYPVMNEDKAKEMVLSWVCSVDKAIKELGYKQKIDLNEGILNTINWYKRHNWL